MFVLNCSEKAKLFNDLFSKCLEDSKMRKFVKKDLLKKSFFFQNEMVC